MTRYLDTLVALRRAKDAAGRRRTVAEAFAGAVARMSATGSPAGAWLAIVTRSREASPELWARLEHAQNAADEQAARYLTGAPLEDMNAALAAWEATWSELASTLTE